MLVWLWLLATISHGAPNGGKSVNLMSATIRVIAVIGKKNKHKEVQKVAWICNCSLVRFFPSLSTISRHASEIVPVVTAAMDSHPLDLSLQLCCLGSLVSLATSEQLEGLEQIYELVLSAMHNHSRNQTVQHYACWVLARLGNHLGVLQDIESGMVKVVAAMSGHRTILAIQQCGCGALLGFCSANETDCSLMLAAEAHVAVVETMRAYCDDPDVQHFGCGLIAEIATTGGAAELLRAGAADAVMFAMSADSLHSPMRRLDCSRALHTLASNDKLFAALQPAQATQAVLQLLSQCHPAEEVAAVHFSVGILAALGGSSAEVLAVLTRIFTDPTEWHCGTMLYVLQALQQKELDARCFELVCATLQCHSAASAALSAVAIELLMQDVSHIKVDDVVAAMEQHPVEAPVQQAAITLFNKILVKSTDSDNILTVTLAAAATHSDNPAIMEEALRLVLKLSTSSECSQVEKITPLIDAARLLRANNAIAERTLALESAHTVAT